MVFHTPSNLTVETLDKLYQKKVAVETLGEALLTPVNLKIGDYDATLINIDSDKSRGDYYEYAICQSKDQDDATCHRGQFLVAGKILLSRENDGLRYMHVNPCMYEFKAEDKENPCGVNSLIRHKFLDNASSVIASEMQQMQQISTEIKKMGQDVFDEVVKLWEVSQKQKDMPEDFLKDLQDTIAMGPLLIGMILNSSDFPKFYKKFYQNNPEQIYKAMNTGDGQGNQELMDELKKMREELDELKKKQKSFSIPLGTMMISLGTGGLFVGAITTVSAFAGQKFLKSGKPALAKKIDGFSQSVSHSLNNFLYEYSTPMTHTQLDELIKASNNGLVRVGDFNFGNNFIKNKSGEIVYYQDGAGIGTVYKSGEGMKVVPSNGFPEMSDKFIIPESKFSDIQKAGLADDFLKVDGGYQLKMGEAHYYRSQGGYLAKLEAPTLVDNFPKFSPDTLARIKKAQFDASQLKDVQWQKGFVFLDEQGRLLEPPEKWKVEGMNWFEGPNRVVLEDVVEAKVGGVAQGVAQSAWDSAASWWGGGSPVDDFVTAAKTSTITFVDSNGVEKVFMRSNVEDYVRLPQSVSESGMRHLRALDAEPVEKLWNLQVSLQDSTKSMKASVDPTIKNFSDGLNKLKYVGIALMVVSVVGIIAASTLQLQPETDNFLTRFEKIEKKIQALHVKRLELLGKIKEKLANLDISYDVDDRWIYLL